MDLEKEELAILDEYEDFGSETMTDDGILFCFIGSGSSGYAYDSNTGQMHTISEWFKNTYGIILSDDRVVPHRGKRDIFRKETSQCSIHSMVCEAVTCLCNPMHSARYMADALGESHSGFALHGTAA